MKNENQCFFSISLENGITITGNNPNEVKTFLMDLSVCISDAIKSKLNKNYPDWTEHIQTIKKQLDEAHTTIKNYQTKKG